MTTSNDLRRAALLWASPAEYPRRNMKERRSMRMAGGVTRFAAITAICMGMTFGLVPHQANAASTITAGLNVWEDPASNIHAYIDVHLPMSQADAAGYLYNGAKISIGCWGDDTFIDDWLLTYNNENDEQEWEYWNRKNPYTNENNRPYAASDGVRLRVTIVAPEGQIPRGPSSYFPRGREGFNEDPGYSGDMRDEIFCRATWIDGDGAKLAAHTPVRSGGF